MMISLLFTAESVNAIIDYNWEDMSKNMQEAMLKLVLYFLSFLLKLTKIIGNWLSKKFTSQDQKTEKQTNSSSTQLYLFTNFQ